MAIEELNKVLGHARALYGGAVHHMVIAVKQGQWRLLHGCVELLPLEIPPPPHDGIIVGPKLPRANYRLYANHVATTVEAALTWFEEARRGSVIVPRDDGAFVSSAAEGGRVCTNELRDQEPHEGWICAGADAPRLPFLSRWHLTPRMQHLVPLDFRWDVRPDEDAATDEFLSEQVGFRRAEWPQLLGSIHLLLPNPYFRAVREHLVAETSTSAKSIKVELEPRHGVTVPEFRVDLVDEHPTGIGASGSIRLGTGATVAPMGNDIRAARATVWTNEGAVIHVSGPGRFPGDPMISMDVGGAERIVSVTDGGGNNLEVHRVRVMHPMTPRPGKLPNTAANVLASMFFEREVRASATRLEQRWFANDEIGARDFVRSLIAEARHRVLIADPYLGGIEASRFGRAVRLARVPVRLLTTGEAFEQRPGSPPVVSAPQLQNDLASWSTTDASLGRIEMKVMPRYELHDRFLRVDDRLYTLGNSLNRLGRKGSLFLRVPDPTPMFAVLEEIWEDAQELADYVAGLPAGS
jgi:hypothetical protein